MLFVHSWFPEMPLSFNLLCVIWCHFYNLKTVKNTHGRVILLVKVQAEACNFTKSITPPWVFFTFFKVYKWCQVAKSVSFHLQRLTNQVTFHYSFS